MTAKARARKAWRVLSVVAVVLGVALFLTGWWFVRNAGPPRLVLTLSSIQADDDGLSFTGRLGRRGGLRPVEIAGHCYRSVPHGLRLTTEGGDLVTFGRRPSSSIGSYIIGSIITSCIFGGADNDAFPVGLMGARFNGRVRQQGLRVEPEDHTHRAHELPVGAPVHYRIESTVDCWSDAWSGTKSVLIRGEGTVRYTREPG